MTPQLERHHEWNKDSLISATKVARAHERSLDPVIPGDARGKKQPGRVEKDENFEGIRKGMRSLYAFPPAPLIANLSLRHC